MLIQTNIDTFLQNSRGLKGRRLSAGKYCPLTVSITEEQTIKLVVAVSNV